MQVEDPSQVTDFRQVQKVDPVSAFIILGSGIHFARGNDGVITGPAIGAIGPVGADHIIAAAAVKVDTVLKAAQAPDDLIGLIGAFERLDADRGIHRDKRPGHVQPFDPAGFGKNPHPSFRAQIADAVKTLAAVMDVRIPRPQGGGRDQHIAARPTKQPVRPFATLQPVIAVSACQRVIAARADQRVIAAIADQDIGLIIARDQMVAAALHDGILDPRQRIAALDGKGGAIGQTDARIAVGADAQQVEGVVARIAMHVVISKAGEQNIIARTPEQLVIAAGAEDPVIPADPPDDILPGAVWRAGRLQEHQVISNRALQPGTAKKRVGQFFPGEGDVGKYHMFEIRQNLGAFVQATGRGAGMDDDDLPGRIVARQFVFAKSPREIDHVDAGTAIDRVIACTGDDHIIPAARIDHIIAATPIDQVRPAIAGQRVIARSAQSDRPCLCIAKPVAEKGAVDPITKEADIEGRFDEIGNLVRDALAFGKQSVKKIGRGQKVADLVGQPVHQVIEPQRVRDEIQHRVHHDAEDQPDRIQQWLDGAQHGRRDLQRARQHIHDPVDQFQPGAACRRDIQPGRLEHRRGLP